VQVAQRGGRCPIPGNIQAQVGRALSTLIQLKLSLLAAGWVGWMASEGPFQPKAFCDSM